MAAIILNGTTFYASDVQEDDERIGTTLQARNGNRRFVHRAFKRRWTITWDQVSQSVRASIRTIHRLTTTFTFTDEVGNSYTVFCDTGAFKSSVGAIIPGPGYVGTVEEYNVTLILTEA